ncbi:glycosyltransferase family 4 protein [Brucepastera parasyntrophica]|uniref:glycosyltransferase family 4 protein n=1 Tax=Brucepastera parasyntrophica TaxID=2880008 RepID=UPI00210C20AC|nr:glycosyltransferase family 1 protein [Brucepastera parasyntrophica]ULQ59721.1 glycosyltransferase family 4 protein [Brucepastera parasyntrophica]
MKIGINTFGCDHGRSGIGSYILSLVRNLPASDFQVDLFGPELDRYTYSSGLESVTYTGLSVSDSLFAEHLWHFFRYPSFVKKQKYDAVLFPAGIKLLPLNYVVPSVVVIQDFFSNISRNTDDDFISGFHRMQLKKAKLIIAASNFIKNDLVNLRIPESMIQVIHNGIDTNLFYPRPQISNEAVLIHPFSIRRPYIIYASRVAFPAKCHVELIRGFSIFKKNTGAPHRLVLAGADGINAEIVHREVLKSPVSSDILLTGYFPHQNLPELYSAADVCVFPSAVEGVGLPVLEAMACGLPVACANAGALPEMAGDCAVYFDQNNPEDIAQAIGRLVKTPGGENEPLRNDLINRGIKWVEAFNWKKSAQGTIDCITSII